MKLNMVMDLIITVVRKLFYYNIHLHVVHVHSNLCVVYIELSCKSILSIPPILRVVLRLTTHQTSGLFDLFASLIDANQGNVLK